MKCTAAILAACLVVLTGCAKKSRIIYPSTPPPYLEESPAGGAATLRGFDNVPVGRLPEGWRVAETKSAGKPATWAVTPDPTAPSPPNVLAITGTKNTGSTYNLAIAGLTSFEDLDLTVQVKANSGTEDQGGGPIWRAKDGDNYYICRLNPLEGNLRVYRVVSGNRRQLGTADAKANAGEWHSIRVVMTGNRIECYLDGRKLLEAQDDALPGAGMIGLWSKADAATAFDDLAVRAAE